MTNGLRENMPLKDFRDSPGVWHGTVHPSHSTSKKWKTEAHIINQITTTNANTRKRHPTSAKKDQDRRINGGYVSKWFTPKSHWNDWILVGKQWRLVSSFETPACGALQRIHNIISISFHQGTLAKIFSSRQNQTKPSYKTRCHSTTQLLTVSPMKLKFMDPIASNWRWQKAKLEWREDRSTSKVSCGPLQMLHDTSSLQELNGKCRTVKLSLYIERQLQDACASNKFCQDSIHLSQSCIPWSICHRSLFQKGHIITNPPAKYLWWWFDHTNR